MSELYQIELSVKVKIAVKIIRLLYLHDAFYIFYIYEYECCITTPVFGLVKLLGVRNIIIFSSEVRHALLDFVLFVIVLFFLCYRLSWSCVCLLVSIDLVY